MEHVDFQAEQGKAFGFLGPNGAGKTTTQRMLTTLLEPTEGRIMIDRRDLASEPYPAKRRMGLVPEESNVYTEHTRALAIDVHQWHLRAPGGDGRLGASAGLSLAANVRAGSDEPCHVREGILESLARSGAVTDHAGGLLDSCRPTPSSGPRAGVLMPLNRALDATFATYGGMSFCYDSVEGERRFCMMKKRDCRRSSWNGVTGAGCASSTVRRRR